jgi:hypothetical protein
MRTLNFKRLERLEERLGLKKLPPIPPIFIVGVAPGDKEKTMTKVKLQGQDITWERQRGESEENFKNRAIKECRSKGFAPIFFADCQDVNEWEQQERA